MGYWNRINCNLRTSTKIHAFIRSLIADKYGKVADSTSILYGGGCNAGNAASYFLSQM